MKLRFSIQYSTKWGENVWVVVKAHVSTGVMKTYRLCLLTDDGEHWKAELAVMESRHSVFTFFEYEYQIRGGDDVVLRREWHVVPRIIPCDNSHDFVMNDEWKDIPLMAHLYTKACMCTSGRKNMADATIKALRQPLYRKTLFFRITAPQIDNRQAVAVCGSHPSLGGWSTSRYLKMSYNGHSVWTLTMNVDALYPEIEYKYVVIDAQTQKLKRWEFGDNRIFGISGNEQAGGQGTPQGEIRVYHQDVYVLHGGEFRIKRVPVHAQFNFDTYIFDLDGTLISSLHDLAASCNYALKLNGMPERTLEEVRMFVGNGVKKLMERAVPGGLENEKFEKTLQDFRQHYMVHNMDNTKPYPDVMEMLEELKNRGKNIAVVSNKFYAATQEICRHFFGDLVDVAIGERENIKKKPAPDTVNEALRQLHADRERAVYIGDSDVDVMTAKNSGMPCISVLWGFRDHDFLLAHGASILISSPLQIL